MLRNVSLGDLLAIAHLTGTLPGNRALIAIQPEMLEWGSSLSDAVAQALPVAAQQAVDLIMEWQTGRTGQGASSLQSKHG
jgi:hydrogenase maturation protease